MADESRNISMDFFRGISAVLVCAGHLRAVMFLDFRDLGDDSVLSQIFYFMTSLGHEAVMVFFVMSGFFVGGSVLSKRMNFSFPHYLIARLSRLWTVLFPALIFTFLIDLFVSHYFPSIISGAEYVTLNSGPDTGYSSSILTFVGNLAFVQTVFVPVFGSNGPLWSLTNEFWYYILFPLAMMMFGLVRLSVLYRVVVGLIFFAITFFIAQSLLAGFAIWLMGVIVYLAYKKNYFNYGWWFSILGVAAFALSLVMSKTKIFDESTFLSSDIVVGFAFSLLLVSIRPLEKTKLVKQRMASFSIWLSDISYTLYVFHFPMLMLLYGLFYMDNQCSLDGSSFLQFMGWLVGLIVISRILWVLFEKRTPVIRRLFKSIWNKVSS